MPGKGMAGKLQQLLVISVHTERRAALLQKKHFCPRAPDNGVRQAHVIQKSATGKHIPSMLFGTVLSMSKPGCSHYSLGNKGIGSLPDAGFGRDQYHRTAGSRRDGRP